MKTGAKVAVTDESGEEEMTTRKDQKVEIHWVHSTPSPYSAYLFNVLHDAPEIELEVHFLRESSPQHPWRTSNPMSFSHRLIDSRFGIDWMLFRAALKSRTKFVIAGWNSPTVWLLVLWLALLGRDFLFWTDAPNIARHRSFPKRLLRSFVTRTIFMLAKKVMGTGRPACDSLAAMGCRPTKLVSLPWFVPLDSLDGHEKALSDDEPVCIVSLGRLRNDLKGYDIGLEALARVRYGDGLSRFRYFIGGSGPDEDSLRFQVSRLGLGENVLFLGWIEYNEVKLLLHKAHILLHPARWEPYGLVVLEAMANSVVVIGSEATCAVRDRIVDGKNGFRHEVGDVETVRRQLVELLTDRRKLQKIGKEARRTAELWPSSLAIDILLSALNYSGVCCRP